MAQAAVDLSEPISHPPAPAGHTDELLAELAAAQIDQMLDSAQSAVTAAPAAEPATLPAEVSAAHAEAEQEIKQAFDRIEAKAADPAAESQPAAPSDEPSSAERSALSTETETALPTGDDELALDAPPGPLISLLELLNWPFNACPDWLRNALGKIAILTLINAVGALVFLVCLNRR